MSILDKELIIICNLLNLKIEFANIIKEENKKESNNNFEDLSSKKILSYHTIYSLIEEELKGIEKRKAIIKERNEKITRTLTALGCLTLETTSKLREIQNKQDEAQRMIEKEYKEKIELSSEKYGSFYLERKNKTKKYSYISKRDLQKNAPILMEYYDRYQYGCEESKFLDEWEVIYGGDYYELMIDYMMRFENELSKIHKNNSTIINRTDKYQYKIDNYIAFREEET